MTPAETVKSVRVGSLRIDLRKYADGRFGFDYQPPGELRVKVRAKKIEDAEEKAREILGAARGGKVERLAIDEKEYAEFLRWRAERGKGAHIPTLVSDYKRVKGSRGLSEHTTRIPFADIDSFALEFAVPIESVTRKKAEDWIDERNVGSRRFNNIREALVSLWRFARREGVIGPEPQGPELIEKKKVKYGAETYTPEQFDIYVNVVAYEWKPSIILGGLCGVRPMEIWTEVKHAEPKPVLEWERFRWAKQRVDMPEEVSKDGRPRFIPICDTAMELLDPWRQAKGPVAPKEDVYKLTPKWAEATGVPWVNDGWRHSYASHRLAETQNIAALSEEMGNSPRMIRRHYLDLKDEDQAKAWFAKRKFHFLPVALRVA